MSNKLIFIVIVIVYFGPESKLLSNWPITKSNVERATGSVDGSGGGGELLSYLELVHLHVPRCT